MTRVWQWNRPVTVREVLEDLQQERSIAYTTVMTVMDNLHQKGWVRREVVGRAYRYTAVSTRAAYSAALMNEAWAQSDNPAAALVAFFGMMSPEQREALNDAIRIVQRDTPEEAQEPREEPRTEAVGERPAEPSAEPPAEALTERTPEPSREAPAQPRTEQPPQEGLPGEREGGQQETEDRTPPPAAIPGPAEEAPGAAPENYGRPPDQGAADSSGAER
ncbi:BlaI/MecI/CopY family transcriptional regulator [Streptomyces coeruleoprunus]|uniref:BlaI/MecI/CopY family transcriptional regulator n=1 Tax=Streptomyces coeruleoprunus TaxID=285563 RepID=A0ABV9XEL3_9ACTN